MLEHDSGLSQDELITMRYKELANAINIAYATVPLEEEKIKRTFIQPLRDNRDRTFAHCATLLVKKEGIVRAVTQAVLVYPAIAWIQKAKSIDDIIEHMASHPNKEGVADSAEYDRLMEIRRLLSSTVNASLRLEQREEYFKRCESFLNLVRSTMNRAVEFKSFDPIKARAEAYRARRKLMDILLSGIDDGELSQYCIRRYLCGLIMDVAEIAGDKIVKSMELLCFDEVPDNAELAYLYHNIEVLLREYKRLMRSEWYTGEKAVKSAQNIANSFKDSAAGVQKCYVTEFMQLIHGSLLLLREFPRDGNDMYEIIMHQQDDSVSQREVFEKQLFMSAPKYYRIKKQATEILGTILWGSSAEVVFDLLL